MGEKKTTIDDLAQMVKRGFDDVQTRFVGKDDFKVLVSEIRLVRDELHDIKGSLRSVVQLVGEHDKEIERLKE